MESKALLICCLGLAFFASFCACEIIYPAECKKESDRITLSTVHNVSVVPCAGAPDSPCDFTRGINATITVYFTPTQKINRRARHSYSWEQSATRDLPFAGINPKACKSMSCPVRKNKVTKYEAVIPIRKNLPTGTYDTKVKLYEGAKVYFCIVFKVKLL